MLNAVMEGAFAHFQPGGSLGGTVRVDPRVMKGLRPGGGVMTAEGIEGLPDMVTHEATHFLNEPGFQKSQGLNEYLNSDRFARALEPFIGQAKYGPTIVGQHLRRGAAPTAANEALSYLSQPTGRQPAATWLHNALTGRERGPGIDAFNPAVKSLLQEALDAALRVPGSSR